jgi:hypothetical protein
MVEFLKKKSIFQATARPPLVPTRGTCNKKGKPILESGFCSKWRKVLVSQRKMISSL